MSITLNPLCGPSDGQSTRHIHIDSDAICWNLWLIIIYLDHLHTTFITNESYSHLWQMKCCYYGGGAMPKYCHTFIQTTKVSSREKKTQRKKLYLRWLLDKYLPHTKPSLQTSWKSNLRLHFYNEFREENLHHINLFLIFSKSTKQQSA